MSTTELLQGIKDAKEATRQAIVAKGAQLAETAKLSEFASAVESIETGGGSSDKWVRPAGWAPLDKIDLTDFEGAYLTYEVKGDGDDFMAIAGGTALVIDEVAVGADGEVAVVQSCEPTRSGNVAYIDLGGYSVGMHVFRITNFTNTFYFNGITKHNESYYRSIKQRCVEVYAQFPSTKTIPYMGDYCYLATYSTQHGYYDMPMLVRASGARSMFAYLPNLIKLELHTTKTQTTFNNAFNGCASLKELIFDAPTSAVTDMSSMFYNCTSLTSLDLSGWNTSAVTNMSRMFNNCISLTSLDLSGWNTSAVTNMGNMFYNCISLTSLDLSGWNTSAVTNMSSMFYSCTSLTSLDLSHFSCASATTIQAMFQHCYSLEYLDLSGLNTSKTMTTNWCWSGCHSLGYLNLSNLDSTNISNTSNLFNETALVTDFVFSPNWAKSISISDMIRLTHDSLVAIFETLPTITTAQTITIGSTNKAKLTSEEISVVTDKGWSVS